MQPPPRGPSPAPSLPSGFVNPETAQGVRAYRINLELDIVFGVLALAVALPSLALTTLRLRVAVLVIEILGATTAALILVFVINFIVSLSPALNMHHGRNMFGLDDSRYARYGTLFESLGATMSVTAVGLVVYVLVLGKPSFFSLSVQNPSTGYYPLLITTLWTAGVSFRGQMYRYFVRSHQSSEARRRMDIASFLIPILGAVGIAVVGLLTARLVFLLTVAWDPMEALLLFYMMTGAVFLPPGLALIGYVVLLVVYGKTSDRLMEG